MRTQKFPVSGFINFILNKRNMFGGIRELNVGCRMLHGNTFHSCKPNQPCKLAVGPPTFTEHGLRGCGKVCDNGKKMWNLQRLKDAHIKTRRASIAWNNYCHSWQALQPQMYPSTVTMEHNQKNRKWPKKNPQYNKK